MAAMSGSILTPSDRLHLLRMMRRHTPSPVHRRMNALLLLDDGWAVERVADALFIDPETVREHRRLYETAGVAGLERLNYEGSDPALSAAQLDALKTELDDHLYMRAKEVCAFVQRTFEVDYTANAIDQAAEAAGFRLQEAEMCAGESGRRGAGAVCQTDASALDGACECRQSAVFR